MQWNWIIFQTTTCSFIECAILLEYYMKTVADTMYYRIASTSLTFMHDKLKCWCNFAKQNHKFCSNRSARNNRAERVMAEAINYLTTALEKMLIDMCQEIVEIKPLKLLEF